MPDSDSPKVESTSPSLNDNRSAQTNGHGSLCVLFVISKDHRLFELYGHPVTMHGLASIKFDDTDASDLSGSESSAISSSSTFTLKPR